MLLTHYQTTILDSSKLKVFADDNFKFDENGRKLSKRVENTVGKGEIARYEQFLLFPQCFQKACFPGASKGVIVWEWVKLDWSNTLSFGKRLNVWFSQSEVMLLSSLQHLGGKAEKCYLKWLVNTYHKRTSRSAQLECFLLQTTSGFNFLPQYIKTVICNFRI